MVRWVLAWSFALGLTGCGAPCVDDGLHSKQSGAACMAVTTSGASTTDAPPATTGAASTSGATSEASSTSEAITTGDVTSGETTATTGAPATTSTTTTATSEGETGELAHCDDDVQDPGETGVSCGGVCVVLGPAYTCGLGEGCEVDGDCDTNHCHVTGTCVDVTCDNDVHDGGLDFHIDCGLSCPGCGLGLPCDGAPNSCFVGACIMGTCALDPSCNDDAGPVDGETDVDCGGPLCGPSCKHGQLCDGPADCIAGSCIDGVCDEPHCINGMMDLGETDIDCGGPCEPCTMNEGCITPDDCFSPACVANKCGG